jgi:hypothetical protein
VPRQIRIEYPGAIYHVLNRGDRREAIFRDDGDCHDFIVGKAARLRAETTLTLGQIAQTVKMGTRSTLSAKLQQRKDANE